MPRPEAGLTEEQALQRALEESLVDSNNDAYEEESALPPAAGPNFFRAQPLDLRI